MDFAMEQVPEELTPFRDEVREVLAAALKGNEHLRWSANWSTREDEEEYQFRRRLARILGERGWLFPTYPVEYGGAGLSAAHQNVLETELTRVGLDLSHVFYTLARIVVPCIMQFGTPEQKAAFLPPMLRGEISVWQVLTEPQSGSDVANCRTTAIRDGDVYVVNGQKVMVGSIHPPDFMWTLVCNNPAGKRHENLGWLYMPGNLPGITFQHMPMLMGIKNAVFFDGVRVPAEYLVGGENNGWAVSSTHMELEHGGAGAVSGDPAVDRMLEYAQQTCRAGTLLIDDPDVRDILADALIEAHVLRLLSTRNYWHRLQREPHPYGGAQTVFFKRMARLHNSERVQQIVGYEAFVPNLDVNEFADFEHTVRAGPGWLHGGGTLDTDRLIIARRMGLGRAVREDAPVTI